MNISKKNNKKNNYNSINKMITIAIIVACIYIALIISGFVMYSKIPNDAANSDQNVALGFAVIGIPIPPLQIVPIVIGSRY